ncbi:MAG: hypothetical protein NTX56_09030 [Proteobacteria bacterium]|nr:hypothetical protein [Pseudomonadota bacterium]
MIDGLIGGKLYGTPAQRVGQSGKSFVTAKPKAWTDRNGETKPSLDMVAHAVLTTYHVTRKRQAVSGKQATAPANYPEGADDFHDNPV